LAAEKPQNDSKVAATQQRHNTHKLSPQTKTVKLFFQHKLSQNCCKLCQNTDKFNYFGLIYLLLYNAERFIAK